MGETVGSKKNPSLATLRRIAVKDMTRIYRRNGHEVTRDEFKQVLTPKGPRYTAKCRACERRLNFVIAMGLVEPKGVKATAIDYCPEGK